MRPFGLNEHQHRWEAIQSERTDRSQVIGKRGIMTKGEQTRRRIVEAAAPIFQQARV